MSAFGGKADIAGLSSNLRSAGRHYPADTLRLFCLLAVVGTNISPPPSACCTPAALLDVAKNFFSPEAIQRQLSRMMTGPIAISFASAIDHQLADAVCLE